MKNISILIRYIYIIFFISLSAKSNAQPNPYEYKLSPTLTEKIKSGKTPDSVHIILTVKANRNNISSAPRKDFEILYSNDSFIFFRTKATPEEIRVYAESGDVLYIEDAMRKARPEQLISSLDLSTNRINYLHDNYPSFDGTGQVVSIKEYKPDTTDIDLKGRYISTPLSSQNINSHATVMATLIAGAGNTWYKGRGAARGSGFSSSSYDILLPDPDQHYTQYGISIQNHSYGVAVENYYGADAAAYDAGMITNPVLQHIFSSGNSGTSSSSTGVYAGIGGYANLTGSFKMAKNILTAGATDSFSVVSALSSKGPAYDGRIAPSLVAFGEDGSSGAAALISGTGLILEQLYKSINGTGMPNQLLRAVLINGANDKGNPGPDYSYGFGSLNAINSFETVKQNHFFSGAVSQGSIMEYNLPVDNGMSKLKMTLVWNDPPAQPNAPKALVNNLDLELKNNLTGEIWKPWILNISPHIDSLRKNATRGIDTLNNIEQVSVDLPPQGNYTITVRGTRIVSGQQSFHIVYQVDTASSFLWSFPTSTDYIFPGEINIIRWETTYSLQPGILEYSFNGGSAWTLIDNNVDLSPGYYRWNVPSLTGTALLRLTINNNSYISKSFTIAARTQTNVAFNCSDSFAFSWNKLEPGLTYRIYELGDLYLEPFLETNDSFLILRKTLHPSLYYAVAPILNGIEGTRSYTFNYTQQGVDCYFSSFISELVNNAAELDLRLGTVYNVSSIVLEKWNGMSFTSIREILPSGLNYHFSDPGLTQGANIYRIRLLLSNGQSVLSFTETVYYFGNNNYIVFPNPVRQSQHLNIAVKNVEFSTALVYNSAGALIKSLILDDRLNKISASQLSKGIYYIKIISARTGNFSTSFIVQ